MSTVTQTPCLRRHAFLAMGTDVELLLLSDGEGEQPFVAAERELHRLERLCSRFLPDSALSRLNRDGGIDGQPELAEIVARAVAARVATGGRFDPTVHDALVAAGYDRSFERIGAARPRPSAPVGLSVPGGEIAVDRRRGRIRLAPGVRVDLGGIAKGYAVDRVCDLLAEHGPCLVNAGGDIAVRGMLAGEPWPIEVEAPVGRVIDPLVVGLDGGGLATSGRDRRRWLQDGRERHHVIDPRTGEPAETDLLRVTALAGSAAEAEVWAKALLLAGTTEAVAEAERREIPCALVTETGELRLVGLG